MTSVRSAWQEKENKITINVSGNVYVTTTETLAKHPHTKLGKLQHEKMDGEKEYFFDEDEDVFKEVLRFQRTGDLHVPKSICRETFLKHLKFWEISEDRLSSCCRTDDKLNDVVLEKQFQWFEKKMPLQEDMKWKHYIWCFLTDPLGPLTPHKKAAKLWMLLYILLVCAQSVILGTLTVETYLVSLDIMANVSFRSIGQQTFSDPCSIANAYTQSVKGSTRFNVQIVISLVFTIEICLRLISCPSMRLYWTRLYTVDLAIAAFEFVSFALFITLSQANIHVELEAECYVLTIGWFLFYLVVQLKIFRLLALTTMFR